MPSITGSTITLQNIGLKTVLKLLLRSQKAIHRELILEVRGDVQSATAESLSGRVDANDASHTKFVATDCSIARIGRAV